MLRPFLLPLLLCLVPDSRAWLSQAQLPVQLRVVARARSMVTPACFSALRLSLQRCSTEGLQARLLAQELRLVATGVQRRRRGVVGLAGSGALEGGADIGAQQLDQFCDLFAESLSSETFVKATLSQNKGEDRTLTNVYLRLVSLKAGISLQAKLRHKTNDVTKNYPLTEARKVVNELLLGGFRQAYLFTSSDDWQLKLGKKPWLKRVGKGPTFEAAAVEKHDRVKALPVDKDARYLQLLGITNAEGAPRPGKSDKLKQIQHFVSVVTRAVEEAGLGQEVRESGARALKLVDMGCARLPSWRALLLRLALSYGCLASGAAHGR